MNAPTPHKVPRLKLVGRSDELDFLFSRARRVLQGQGEVVLISGEPGIGKSALIRQFSELVSQPNNSLGKSLPTFTAYARELTGEIDPYHVFDQLLQAFLSGLQTSDKKSALSDYLAEVGPDWVQTVPIVGSVASAIWRTTTWFARRRAQVGLAARLPSQQQIFVQYSQFFREIPKRVGPFVLILEDIHWMDNGSAALLYHLVSIISDLPVLILCSWRPSEARTREGPERPTAQVVVEICKFAYCHFLNLKPLSAPAVSLLLEEYFSSGEVPVEIPSWFVEKTGGNPLFLEQYLVFLKEENLITSQMGRIELKLPLKQTQTDESGSPVFYPSPEPIKRLLGARINRLPLEDQEILRKAAIQGERFITIILAAVLNCQELSLIERLRYIADLSQLVSYLGAIELGKSVTDQFQFLHSLLHQVCYMSLTVGEREAYHRKAAQAFEQQLDASSPSYQSFVMQLAYQWQAGGVPVSSAHYLSIAGKRALGLAAYSDAERIAIKGLTLLRKPRESIFDPETAKVRFELLWIQNALASHRGRRDEQRKILQVLDRTAKRLRDPDLCVQVGLENAWLSHVIGDLEKAVAIGKNTLRFAIQTGNSQGQAQSSYLIATSYAAAGSLRMAVRYFKKAESLYKNTSVDLEPTERFGYQYLLDHLGLTYFDLGRYEDALRCFGEAIQIDSRFHGMSGEVIPARGAGITYAYLGRYKDALKLIRGTLKVQRLSGNSWLEGACLVDLAFIAIELEKYGRAEIFLRQGIELLKVSEFYWVLVDAYNYLSRVYWERGDIEKADQALYWAKQALQLSRRRHLVHGTIAALSNLAMGSALAGLKSHALRYSQRAVYLLRKQKSAAIREEEVYFRHAMLLSKFGSGKYKSWLRRSYQELRRKGDQLKDGLSREDFFSAVRLNREILRERQIRE